MTQDLHYKDFDKIISSKLGNQSVDVNDRLWENINSHLLKKQLFKSKRQVRLQRIAIILLVALFITSLIIFTHSKSKSGQNIALSKKENITLLQNKQSNKLEKSQQKEKLIIKQEHPKTLYQPDKKEQIKEEAPASLSKNKNPVQRTLNNKNTKVSGQTHLPINNKTITIPQPTVTQKQETPVEEKKTSSEILSDNEISGDSNVHLTENNNVTIAEQDSTNQSPSSQNLLVQNDKTNPKEQKKIAIQIFASPEYSYRSVRNNDAHFNPKYDKAYFNSRDKGQFSFSAGLLLSINIRRNLNLSTGISYSKYNQKFNTNMINVEMTNNGNGFIYTSSGMVQVTIHSSDTVSQNTLLHSSLQLSYINIPVVAEYYFLPNMYFQAGINFNMLTKEDMQWQAENEDDDCEILTNNIEGLKTTNVSLIIGSGKEFPIFKTYKFVFQPSFRIFLTSINDKNSVKTYPYSYFLHLGIKKTF